MKQRNILFNRQGGNQAVNWALDRSSSFPQGAVDVCSR
jgi:hypothetical protein